MGISLKEEVPELKIFSDTIFYFNYDGVKIPTSNNYKPNLPHFLGNPNKSKVKELLFLVNNFKKDDFLKNQLKTIRYESNSYYIKLNSFDFTIYLFLHSMPEKLKNLKFSQLFIKVSELNQIIKK